MVEAAQPHRAAGILLVSPQGRILMARRRPGGDHGGHWAFFGGGIEAGETAEQAARREFQEETGREFQGPLRLWTRRIKDGVDFSTFVGHGEEFEPALNKEHDLAKWVTLEEALADPPGEVILHPGAVIALKRFGMDELEIAQAIRDGELVSPQRFGNLLLVALRVTGTGASYRKALDEFVWRDPALYLNDHFLARCNGLEVIWLHPKGELDSKEFRERIVGTSFLPYIKDEEKEVWTIARIRDEDAALLLEHEKLSTSPGVGFLPGDGNRKVSFGDAELLIEGKPSVLDHLALCPAGVWDKLDTPDGVQNLAGEKREDSDSSGAPSSAPTPLETTVSKEKGSYSVDDAGAKIDSILDSCGKWDESRKDSKFSEMVKKLEKREGYSKEVATKTAAKIGRETIGAHEMAKRAAASRARH